MGTPSIHSSSLVFLGSCFPAFQVFLLPSPKLERIETPRPSSGWSCNSELPRSAAAFIFFQPCLGSQVIIGVCESFCRRMGSDESAESCGFAGDEVAWHGRPG